MTNTNNTSGGSSSPERVGKPIEIDRELWQCVQDEAAANGTTTSKTLEKILSSYLDNND